MLLRGCVVVLLVLNLGVALWWALRDVPSPPATEPLPAGAVRLQLLSELTPGARRALGQAAPATPRSTDTSGAAVVDAASVPPDAAAAPAAGTPAAPVADTPACVALGPFADAAAADAARGRLGDRVTAVRTRIVAGTPARGWRVVLPAAADRTAAEATVARIAAAGISDYFIVNEGAEANSIALGRYRAEPSARQREATLRAAGFEAQAQPLGQAAAAHWVDARLAPGTDAAAARGRTGAAQAGAIDCAPLR